MHSTWIVHVHKLGHTLCTSAYQTSCAFHTPFHTPTADNGNTISAMNTVHRMQPKMSHVCKRSSIHQCTSRQPKSMHICVHHTPAACLLDKHIETDTDWASPDWASPSISHSTSISHRMGSRQPLPTAHCHRWSHAHA